MATPAQACHNRKSAAIAKAAAKAAAKPAAAKAPAKAGSAPKARRRGAQGA